MARATDKVRRWLGWSVALLVLVGVVGLVGYRVYAEFRREDARQREDAETLRAVRYWDAVEDLLRIGDRGDEPTRERCRHALKMLELLEPVWYQTWMAGPPRKEREWMSEPEAGQR